MKRNTQKNNRNGFSLVELVVVVLIMGILAAVAAPRLFDKMGEARESATKQSLSVIRGAIDAFKTNDSSGEYPTAAATLVDDLKPYMKGAFPRAEAAANDNADVSEADEDITSADTSGKGWIYYPDTGDIRVNDSKYISW